MPWGVKKAPLIAGVPSRPPTSSTPALMLLLPVSPAPQ
jgi:hypothetical protein